MQQILARFSLYTTVFVTLFTLLNSASVYAFEPDKRFQIQLGIPCQDLLQMWSLDGNKGEPLPTKLKTLVFNVENLGSSVGKFDRQRGQRFEYSRNNRNRGIEPKPLWKRLEILRILLKEDPDVVTFTEVEDIEAANQLLDQDPLLRNKYQKFLIEGNDDRGIDILTMVRKSLPLNATYESFKNTIWKDPTDGKIEPLFSRDIPVLSLFVKGAKTPSYIIMGNHAKSMRTRPGDESSNTWRRAQYMGARMIYEKYRAKYNGKPQFIFQGDFNLDVLEDPALQPIRDVLVSVSPRPLEPGGKVITHTFHPRTILNEEELKRDPKARPIYGAELEAVQKQMDDIRVSLNAKEHVLDAYVVQIEGQSHEILSPATSYAERGLQASDHWPLAAIMRAIWILE